LIRIVIILTLLASLYREGISQGSGNNKLLGKWITCKMIDTPFLGSIGLESIDSFKTSIKKISNNKNSPYIKYFSLDTIVDDTKRFKIITEQLIQYYNLFHGTWVEFHADSTLIEHIGGVGNFRDVKRTFEYDDSTNKLVMDKYAATEIVRVTILSTKIMLLSFYSEGLNVLVKRVE
jgi:hypothetical protein